MFTERKHRTTDDPKGRPVRAIVIFVAGLVCGLLFLGLAGLRTAVWGTPCLIKADEFGTDWQCVEWATDGSLMGVAPSAGLDLGMDARPFDLNELWLRRALVAGQPFESISVSVPGKGNLVFTDRDAGIVVSYAETPRGRF